MAFFIYICAKFKSHKIWMRSIDKAIKDEMRIVLRKNELQRD